MSIIYHILILLVLLITSADLAAIQGPLAQRLNLPGSSIATFTPCIVLITYILAVSLRKVNKWFRLIWILVIFFLLYPAIIFSIFTQKIKTDGFLPGDDFRRFKAEFGVTAVRYSSEIIMARRDFRPEMVSRLRELSAAAQAKKQPNAPVQHPSN